MSIAMFTRSCTAIVLAAGFVSACNTPPEMIEAFPAAPDAMVMAEGKQTFRFETFGNEAFWTDTLRMNTVVQSGVDPVSALKMGLKVDAGVLPAGILQKVDLKDPATTAALLKLNAIVGLQATVDDRNNITRLGITCALCHSTVDNSVMPGIGQRQDGWPNRDLNVGAIIALSPALTAAQKAVYNSWGPGKYDPRFNHDGKNTPVVLPPVYGLERIKNSTYTGDGTMAYWNAYVAVTQMHGAGSFSDDRLNIHVTKAPDQVTGKLSALGYYQHSLEAPPNPAAVDVIAVQRGRVIFERSCAGCHVGGSGTDNNSGKLHKAKETGMDNAYALRTVNQAYRTTPLRGLWQHAPYFHDGSAASLGAVVTHYNRVRSLGLNEMQQRDLVEYLKTL